MSKLRAIDDIDAPLVDLSDPMVLVSSLAAFVRALPSPSAAPLPSAASTAQTSPPLAVTRSSSITTPGMCERVNVCANICAVSFDRRCS